MLSRSEKGYFAIFLHAHLPWVRHPEVGDALEEDWLYEALTETYIPIIILAERWLADGIPARLTLSITPTLLEMLGDPLLRSRYERRLDALVGLSEREVARTRGDTRFHHSACMYRDRFLNVRNWYNNLARRDIIGPIRALRDAGILEVTTSCATHAYLPCLSSGTHARAQVRIGVQCYEKYLGQRPRGMWLPECGYIPGLDIILAREGLEYFLVDAHAVQFSTPGPLLGTSAPLVCPSGVLAFPRDLTSSSQVWSAERGYPGDGRYREFYRDIGHDLPEHELTSFLLPGGIRRNVGIKYHRITSRNRSLGEKEPYHRGMAMDAVDSHASHFVAERVRQFEHSRSTYRRPAVIVSPYDAELFGHWWFEGPEFLDLVVRKAAFDQDEFRLATLGDIADSELEFQVAVPAASSWGAYGYSDTWLNDRNDWIWPILHACERHMVQIASNAAVNNGLTRRALNQLARELVLLCSSDWPFIMTMGTMVPYAHRRVNEHSERFRCLLDGIRSNAIDEATLSALEAVDNIFPWIDFQEFSERGAGLLERVPMERKPLSQNV
jgi:1,4-alpha-glucan branching enzyme